MHFLFFTPLLLYVVCLLTPVAASSPVSGGAILRSEVDGLNVKARGDSVIFRTLSKTPALPEAMDCNHNLLCSMKKNNTEAVILNSQTIKILYKTEKASVENPENTINTEPLFSVIQPLNHTSGLSPGTATVHLFSHELIQPTKTLNTGLIDIDNTPAILNISTPVMKQLAEIVTTVSEHYRQSQSHSLDRPSLESLSSVMTESSEHSRIMLTTIHDNDQTLLTSPSILSPQPTAYEFGDDELLIKTSMGTLAISLNSSNGNNHRSTSSATYSFRQVPSDTDNNSETRTATETTSEPKITESLQTATKELQSTPAPAPYNAAVTDTGQGGKKPSPTQHETAEKIREIDNIFETLEELFQKHKKNLIQLSEDIKQVKINTETLKAELQKSEERLNEIDTQLLKKLEELEMQEELDQLQVEQEVTTQNSQADFASTSLQPDKTFKKHPENTVLPVIYEQLQQEDTED